MSLAAANQYAKALLEVVVDPRSQVQPEAALQQLDAFRALFAESEDLRTVLHSPAVDHKAKKAAISRLGDLIGMSETIKNFLGVVIHKGRIQLLDEISEMFRKRLDENLGIARAHVIASQELGQPERLALESEVGRLTGKQVRCEYSVDPALVGGVTVKVGSVVYDGSVRGQLEGLRRRLSSEA